MLKLHQIYIKKLITLFLILFLIIGLVASYWSKNFYINETQNLLLHNIKLISYNISNIRTQNLDKLVIQIKQDINIRTTIIDEKGDVIAESHKNKYTMDNHINRQEIIASQKSDYGFVIRYSDTLSNNLLYVAKRYEDIHHHIFYIRCAKSVDEVYSNILVLGFQVIAILVLFFIFMILIITNINNQIQKETNQILKFLYGLTKKRKETFISSKFSIEFQDITRYLTKVSKILTKQDKQKDKYTKRLKSSNAQKDDIISAISHEFKNPISVISGYSQTLIEDTNINIDVRRKFLNKIHNNSQRLTSLIDTLRLSIKLEQDKQTISKQKVKLSKIVNESIELLHFTYPKRDIILHIIDDIEVSVDETLFSIIVVNLLENALKYSQDEVKVEISSQRLKIIDVGIGISSEYLDKITNKFFRVSDNSWNNSLGLGLAIVDNIVKLHNFKLIIHSKKDEGSTFEIKLK